MESLRHYTMPSYYSTPTFYPLDLSHSGQMPCILEVDHGSWQTCDSVYENECEDCYDANEEDYESGDGNATELNPDAPDFNPDSMNEKNSDWEFTEDQQNDFQCVLNIGHEQLKVSAESVDLVLAANFILNDVFGFLSPNYEQVVEYSDDSIDNLDTTKDEKPYVLNKKLFSAKAMKLRKSSSPSKIPLVKPEISYERSELMAIAESPLCKVIPENLVILAKRLPKLVKKEGPTPNILIKQVKAIKKQEETFSKCSNKETIEGETELMSDICSDKTNSNE